MEEIKRLVLAMQFMTRLPIPIEIDVEKREFYRTASYFPVVGIVIGSILSLLYFALKNFFSREIVMTFIVAFSYVLTGAMHIDGLSDTFDGLFSNKDKSKMLEIMRDSRLGTNGVLAAIFIVVLKILFLTNIHENITLTALLITPIIGRLSIVFSMMISKSARGGEGLGGLMLGKVGIREFAIAFVISIATSYFILPLAVFVKILTISLFVTYIVSKYISLRIGGMTGDTLGAVNELAELTALICFVSVSL